MADMLEATGPLEFQGPNPFPSHAHRSKSDQSPRRLSDSDDDYSDEPALGELRNDLRSTTERLFMRRRSARMSRRSSERYADKGALVASNTDAVTAHLSLDTGLRHRNSCNGLSQWEKSVGRSMSRSISKSASCSPETGGSCSTDQREYGPSRNAFLLRNLAGSARLGDTVRYDDVIDGKSASGGVSDTDDGCSAVSSATNPLVPSRNSYRGLLMPASPYTPSGPDTYPPPTSGTSTGAAAAGAEIGIVAGEVETPSSHDALVKTVLLDLRARSEDAGRILEALKVVLMDDSMAESVAAMKYARPRGQTYPQNLWHAGSRESSEEIPASMNRSSTGGGGSGSDKRMPLLLLAMDHMKQMTTQLSHLLKEDCRRASAPPSSLPRHPSRRFERHQRWRRQRPAISSVLLRRRGSARGQVEPISCGVPRYRIQVGRLVDDVYFEVAITQARSMWTVERRLDEFYELRRSLIATASEQAAAAAAVVAVKRQRGSIGDALLIGRGEGGNGSGGCDDKFRDYAESRVPKIAVGESSWLMNSSIGFIMSGRKREEVLAERQVLLASWLAEVLADPQLMSTDLIRFLGGAGDGVLVQPIIEESPNEADESESVDSQSESTDLEESGDWANTGVYKSIVTNGRGEELGNGVDDRPWRWHSGSVDHIESATCRQATLRSESQPSRAPQLVSTLSHSESRESHGSEAVADGDRLNYGWEASKCRRDEGEAEEGGRGVIFASPVSPTLSFTESMKGFDEARSPSSSLSTPPRQLSLDDFFRAPT